MAWIQRLGRWKSAAWLAICLPLVIVFGCSPSVDADQPPAEDETRQTDEGHRGEPNRLADETSPYLLLHAHNPVDWYPWGDEALEKAQREDKLIFLSIGYSSCHWCHVMERESFMDEEIAAFLNEHFVCIKVDREERPDIDSIYMTALLRLSGGRNAGWPMSMFLTPDARPFVGGTYFPARDGDRGSGIGFLTLIKRVQEFWQENREIVLADAETLTEAVRVELDGRLAAGSEVIPAGLIDRVHGSLARQFDPDHGGFGYRPANPQTPKFPEPSNLLFLLDRARDESAEANAREDARRMLTMTLDQMYQGGIYDHLGGGFHRYSVDRFWHIPHFEKMLYDNGQLATVYAEAYALTGDPAYRRVVEETLEFVLREMTSPEGGFYAALDADSEGEEGKFYRWTREELEEALEADLFATFASVYGIGDEPNFEGEFFVPQLERSLTEIANERGVSRETLLEELHSARRTLMEIRNQRTRPLTDTKILTGWNGLMIRGFADAGRILEEPRYVEAAARAADFVLNNLRSEEGRLLRTYSRDEAKLNAYLDDYAFLVDGLLALYRATGEDRWLQQADELTRQQREYYWDDEHGGFFFTSDDHESLIARVKNPTDSVRPSGNSVAAQNLLALAEWLDRTEYFEDAERTLQSASQLIDRAPGSVPRLALAYRRWVEAGGIPEAPAPDTPEETTDDRGDDAGEASGDSSADDGGDQAESSEDGSDGADSVREAEGEPAAPGSTSEGDSQTADSDDGNVRLRQSP